MSKKILIVGDTPRWIEAVKTVLPEDVDLYIATDYINALGLLFNSDADKEIQFDLHIVGNKIPDLQDGIRILSEIREDNRDKPCIIFSDHTNDETQKLAQQLDALIVPRHNGLSLLQEAVKRHL